MDFIIAVERGHYVKRYADDFVVLHEIRSPWPGGYCVNAEDGG
jgi:hypothetical protein